MYIHLMPLPSILFVFVQELTHCDIVFGGG